LLKAQGHSPIRFKQKMGGLAYDLSLINADSDLSGLISGMQTMQQGRVCLYGIPGTGKTAFGKHLAEQLDKAFIHKKPSDILSPYVGMMEKNLATAFEEAELENGVLQIDEVDSFLANRSHAERSWEVSQVNEMLAQLENYQGIIIVTTNRLKDMDEAVLRRFDLKIELKPLTNEQAWSFLQNVLTEKADNELDVQARLNRLSPLTPGDFYAAKRGLTLSGKAMNAENWLTALEGEVSVKPQYHKSQGIGFTSHLSA
jgi:SpoVK/Ycf46/Vps4 family AAA+-type ATPase